MADDFEEEGEGLTDLWYDPIDVINTLAAAMYNISLCDFEGDKKLIKDRKCFFDDSMVIIGKCNRLLLKCFEDDTADPI